MKKSLLLNILAGIIIIGAWIFHIANGEDPLFPVIMIGLYVVSFIMERMGVNKLYWGALTTLVLVFSLWTILPRLAFGP
ncbi:hypothetical protein [Peribacillus frigoritolerans]|uniref:hypothetical protein n=1 Tax=Peribacillus frigoritolerans TaxID=450367 RepID=UPI001DDEB02C|nr:hypothetical protein [Listeria monocytogenes]